MYDHYRTAESQVSLEKLNFSVKEHNKSPDLLNIMTFYDPLKAATICSNQKYDIYS